MGCNWVLLLVGSLSLASVIAAEQSTLTLGVSGTVSQLCSVSGLPSSAITLDVGKTKAIQFAVNCNTPFKYSVVSAFGGLKHENSGQANKNAFKVLIPYLLSLHIPLEQGNKSVIEDSCSSQALKGPAPSCAFSDSGSSIAMNKMATLAITASKLSHDAYLAGNYSDLLVIEMAVN